MKDADQQIIALLNQIKALSGGGGGGTAWGAITGTLSAQGDLNTALGTKQTAAQVQALIDAALAGKGVIGTASFDPRSGSISDPVVSGIISTVVYNAEGVFDVAFTGSLPDANYAMICTTLDDPLQVKIVPQNEGGFSIKSFIPSASLVTGVISYAPTDTKRITVYVIK